MTGFAPATRKQILKRDGHRCARCTRFSYFLQVHHRRPRGMGGSSDWLTNSAANGVTLCPDCHRFIESHRQKALALGWLVRQGQDPRKVPLLYQGTTWAYLDTDGGITYERRHQEDSGDPDRRQAPPGRGHPF